ncbi:MAG TPA: hypothetical protein VMG08_06880 [Allosphingosinicella sp.]|nr:hypothetical protein [Allosphingosinicella sp.]
MRKRRLHRSWSDIALSLRSAARDCWKIALFLGGFAALILGAASLASHNRRQPTSEDEAVVMRFGSRPSKYAEPAIVIVRLRDGSSRQLLAAQASLRLCRPGSRIRIVRQGGAIRVAAQGCGSPAS